MKKRLITLGIIIFTICLVNISFANESSFSDLPVFEDLYLVSDDVYDNLKEKDLTYENAIIFIYDVLMDDKVNFTSYTLNYEEAYNYFVDNKIIRKEISNKKGIITEYDYYMYMVRILGYTMDEEVTSLDSLLKNIGMIDKGYIIKKEPLTFEESLKLIIKMFSKNMRSGENSFDYYLKKYTENDLKYLRSYQAFIAENNKYIVNSLEYLKRYIKEKGSSKHKIIDAGLYNKDSAAFDTLQLTDKFMYVAGTYPTNKAGSHARVNLETFETEEISDNLSSLLYPYGRYGYYSVAEKWDGKSKYSTSSIYRINLLTKKTEKIPNLEGRIFDLSITNGKLYYVEWYEGEYLPGKERNFNKLQSVDLNDYSVETLEDCSSIRFNVGPDKLYYTKFDLKYTTYTGTEDTTHTNNITFVEYDPIAKEKKLIRKQYSLYRNYDRVEMKAEYEAIKIIGINDKYMYTYKDYIDKNNNLSNIFERMDLESFEIIEMKTNFKVNERVWEAFLVDGYMGIQHGYGGMAKNELYRINGERLERVWSNKE